MKSIRNLLWKLAGLGPLNGLKTLLGYFLLIAPSAIPGFPVIQLGNITAAQILLACAALKKALELAKVKPV